MIPNRPMGLRLLKDYIKNPTIKSLMPLTEWKLTHVCTFEKNCQCPFSLNLKDGAMGDWNDCLMNRAADLIKAHKKVPAKLQARILVAGIEFVASEDVRKINRKQKQINKLVNNV